MSESRTASHASSSCVVCGNSTAATWFGMKVTSWPAPRRASRNAATPSSYATVVNESKPFTWIDVVVHDSPAIRTRVMLSLAADVRVRVVALRRQRLLYELLLLERRQERRPLRVGLVEVAAGRLEQRNRRLPLVERIGEALRLRIRLLEHLHGADRVGDRPGERSLRDLEPGLRELWVLLEPARVRAEQPDRRVRDAVVLREEHERLLV